jgi:hypothetical protein
LPDAYSLYSQDRAFDYLRDDTPERKILSMVEHAWDTFAPTTTFGSSKDMECSACKNVAGTARTVLGNEIVAALLVDAVIMACRDIMGPVFGYNIETCPGIVQQQLGDSIIPLLTTELWTDETACTFILPVCDQDKWTALRIKDYVYDVIKTKTPEALSNDYINNLYKEQDPVKRRPKEELIKLALISDLHLDFDYQEGADA